MKVVLFYDKEPQSTLCYMATGSRAYHIGFTDGDWLWDMNWMRRKRVWNPSKARRHLTVDAPAAITWRHLDHMLLTDDNHYGFFDYLWFGVKRIAGRLARRLRFNGKGLVCSEMVANDLKACGWEPPADFPEVPSPGDLEEALLGRRNAIQGG